MINIEKKLGWKPSDEDKRDQVFQLRDILVKDYIDLTIGKFPPVRNQLNIGACVHFGGGTGLWKAMMNDLNYTTPAFHPSELFTYYNTRMIEGTVMEDSGSTIRNFIKSVSSGRNGSGVAPYELWQYLPQNLFLRPPVTTYVVAKKFKAIKYARVDQTDEAISNVLALGYPVIFGHMVKSNFRQVKSDGIVPMPSGPLIGGHCEIICGRDARQGRKPMYKVQNSWGTERGEHGYEYFSFDHILDDHVSSDFWVIYDVSI